MKPTMLLEASLITGLMLLCGPLVFAEELVEYYHLDALGNVRAVTNQAGQVIERHDYLPFGEECLTGPCASNPGVGAGQPRKFTGKERDAETGLDYFGARYYGSKIGRFTTVDPVYTWKANLENPQRWNRYAYSLNNPLRYVDPDGRWPTHVKTVRQNAIDRSLGFLPETDRAILRNRQVVADQDQSSRGATKHAMRGPDLTVQQARDQANAYVRQQLEVAQRFEKEGKRDIAMVALGNAIHTFQDATSPQHEGFQEWNENWGNTSSQVRDHIKGEFYDPGKGSPLDAATRRGYEYSTGAREMPKDFFAPERQQ